MSTVMNLDPTMGYIVFGRLHPDVILPSKRREDAGFDIYPYFDTEDLYIAPHETIVINTGLVSQFSNQWFVLLAERGSTGSIGISQRCGIIDSGYRGEWRVILTNLNSRPIVITKRDVYDQQVMQQYNTKYSMPILYPYKKAICQAIVLKNYNFGIAEDTVENVQAVPSDRGTGRMGSSGK